MLGIDFPEVDGNEVDDSALPDLDEDEGEEEMEKEEATNNKEHGETAKTV